MAVLNFEDTPVFDEKHDVNVAQIIGTFSSILFDMDGTLIDSTNAIVKFWESIGAKYGIDPKTILATSHGRRSIEVFEMIDPACATWEHVRRMEGQIPFTFGGDATPIPGAHSLLSQLSELEIPWGIVTSGTRPLVTGWLEILGMEEPRCLVTAEDVEKGKPNPGCYLLGQKRQNLLHNKSVSGDVGENRVLVFEDAPAGIRAGKAAGCMVVALATTHQVGELWEAGADWVVGDLTDVIVRLGRGKEGEGRSVEVEIQDSISRMRS